MEQDAIERAIRLSLLEKSEGEREKLRETVEDILSFVAEVQSVAGSDEFAGRVNMFRDDAVTVPAGIYRDEMLAQAPARHKDWFLSKKILS